jgi:hypothetical protein
MSGKPKPGWGGSRPGAGRKTKPASIRQVNAMLQKGERWAENTGYDVDEFLLAVIGGDKKLLGVKEVPLKDRITCAKIWKDFTMSRVTEHEQNININDSSRKPVIYLPALKEDPALKVVKGGKNTPEKKGKKTG